MTKSVGMDHSLSIAASQMEAASSLLKFAADDLSDLLGRSFGQFSEEIQFVVKNLQAQAATLDGNAAFCRRIGEADDQDETDDTAFMMPAEHVGNEG